MVPEWWESLTSEERFALVDRFNQEQAAEDDLSPENSSIFG
jgi:hypothetical protein